MIEEKVQSLEELKSETTRLNRALEQFNNMFKKAVQAGATVPELEKATGLTGAQLRYQAKKENLRITPAQRGPKAA